IALTIALFVGAVGIYSGSAAAGTLAILIFVAGICVAVIAVVTLLAGLNYVFQTGMLALVIGIALTLLGLGSDQASAYTAGVSLIVAGAAVTLVMLKFQQRLIFTVM